MSTFTLDPFKDPFFIGFNRELERLNNIHTLATRQSYPPYDIVKFNDDEYVVSIAIAGFDKEDVTVTVHNGSLVVKGEAEDLEIDGTFIHKGIAARKFTRTFALGEYMEVSSAEFKDGMLNINIKRNVPEEKKPKVIEIN